MAKERRGRSKGDSPFMRRDVDVSINPLKTKMCPISQSMGISRCVGNDTCWFWGPDRKCRLSTLVEKVLVYLGERGR